MMMLCLERWLTSLDVFVRVASTVLLVIRDQASSLRFAPHHILVDNQAVQPDRASGMCFAGTDTDLRAQSISCAVGESSASVDVDVSRVQSSTPGRHGALVLRDDRVGVMRRVRVDVLDRLLDGFDGLDSDSGTQELGGVI